MNAPVDTDRDGATPLSTQVVERLEAVRIESGEPGGWSAFAPRIGGSAQAGTDPVTVTFAAGKRLEATSGVPGRLAMTAWSVPDASVLDVVEARAQAVGAGTHRSGGTNGDPPAIAMVDPDGVAVEVRAGVSAGSSPGDGLAQLGHVVTGVEDLDRSLGFYTGILGLGISDRVRIPLRGGGSTVGVFLHAGDRRHHSLALIDSSTGLRHVMVELDDLDAVGAAYDACEDDGAVTRTLGRHTNDRMVSFYAAGPDGVEIEVGCGGDLVADPTPETTYDTPSVWGHRFVQRDGGVA